MPQPHSLLSPTNEACDIMENKMFSLSHYKAFEWDYKFQNYQPF